MKMYVHLYIPVPAMKACRGSRDKLHSFLILMLGGGSGQPDDQASLCLGKSPDTHSLGSWVGPRASLDLLEKRKTLCPCWDLKLRLSSLSPSVYTNYTTFAYEQYFIRQHTLFTYGVHTLQFCLFMEELL
jgi:hypothetical protein